MMKRIFLLILILIMSISLFAQDTEEVKEIAIQPDSLSTDSIVVVEDEEEILTPDQEKLCQEIAVGLIDIYKNWDYKRDFNILQPRVEEFVNDFYNVFPDFTIETPNETVFEKRAWVAYRGMKEKMFEE